MSNPPLSLSVKMIWINSVFSWVLALSGFLVLSFQIGSLGFSWFWRLSVYLVLLGFPGFGVYLVLLGFPGFGVCFVLVFNLDLWGPVFNF